MLTAKKRATAPRSRCPEGSRVERHRETYVVSKADRHEHGGIDEHPLANADLPRTKLRAGASAC